MLTVLGCVRTTFSAAAHLPLKLAVMTAVMLPAASQLKADDWPAYLNGADRAGFTEAKLPGQLQPAWVYRTPAPIVKAWAGPRNAPIEGHEMRHRVAFDSSIQTVIRENRVYFGSTVDNNVYCVDATTGKPVWTFPTDGPIRLAPSLAFENVYFGSDDGSVYCVSQQTGELVWKQRVGPADDRLLARGEMISRWPVRTGVLIDGDIAYFGAGVFPHELIYMVAADARTGEILWKNDTISQQNAGRNDLSPQGYLLANDTTLFVPSGRSLPVALSRETGDIVFQRKYSWRTDAGGVVGGTKALLGDGQVYAGGPHHFLAMDEASGAVGESYIGGRQMVLADDLAYLMDGEKVFCVDRAEHARASQEKQKWFLRARSDRRDPKKLANARQKMKEYAGVGIVWEVPCDFDDALIATADYLIAGGQDEVWMIDRQDGKIVWKSAVEGNVTGLAATDDVLTVSTETGCVYAFRASNGPTANWPAKPETAFDDDRQKSFRTAAAQILKHSQQTTGFCLVVGCEEGRLAAALAEQSRLTIFAVEDDAAKAEAARKTLEAAGLQFDALWLMQMSDTQWPPAPAPNGLLPIRLQKQAGMPRCDANREVAYAQQLSHLLIHSSPRTVVSFAAHNGDLQPRLSPVLARLLPEPSLTGDSPIQDEAPSAAQLNQHPYYPLLQQSQLLQIKQEQQGPALQAHEQQTVRGGSRILTDQAVCPFNAFATHRLGCQSDNAAVLGLSPAERGNLLHNSLERLWQILQSQQQLLQQEPEALQQLITTTLQQCTTELTDTSHSSIGPQYLQLEQQRLQQLLLRWFDIEKQRPPFTVVATEKALRSQLSELSIKLRIDRIDQTEQGLVLIDYKTGQTTVNHWQGDRPAEAQLPLYALSFESSQDLGAVCFAQINTKQIAFKGLSADSVGIQGITAIEKSKLSLPNEWGELVEHWRHSLTQLADDFCAGAANLDIYHPSLMERYSHLLPLNRLLEQERLEQAALESVKPDEHTGGNGQ